MDILSTIASGLAGWLTYEDMLRNVRHHTEDTLHPPIREIAKANGFVVKEEFPLPRRPGQLGGPKRIDFVLASARSKEFIVLELKFKKTALAMAGSLTGDARKIAGINAAVLNETIAANPDFRLPRCEPDWTIRRAVMLVWREGDIAKAMLSRHEHKILRNQVFGLLKQMCSDPENVTPRALAEAMLGGVPIRPVSALAGQLRFAATKTRRRYWVVILNRRPEWTKLPAAAPPAARRPKV